MPPVVQLLFVVAILHFLEARLDEFRPGSIKLELDAPPGRLRHVGQSGILWQSGVVSREVDSCDTRSAMIQGGMWHDATRDRSYRGAL